MPIISWYKDRDDIELETMVPFLQELSKVDDVRPILTKCCLDKETFDHEQATEYCKEYIKN